jgi:hypothetical protein
MWIIKENIQERGTLLVPSSRPARRRKRVFIYKETFGICNIINTLGHRVKGEWGGEGGGENIAEECSRLPTKRESSTGGMSSGEEWTIRKIKYMQRETLKVTPDKERLT